MCDGSGWYLLAVPFGHPDFAKLQRCSCGQRADRLERSVAAMARLGDELGALSDRTFGTFRADRPIQDLYTLGSLYLPAANYERLSPEKQAKCAAVPPEAQAQKLAEALQTCAAYAAQPSGWLCLHGAYGAGKSHLAAAIAHERARHGESVRYRSTPGLLDALRRGIEDNTATQTLEDVIGCDLLVLDDLGAEHLTGWAKERMFRILNERERRPTVLTSNLHPDDLAPPDDLEFLRLVSRIVGNSRIVWLPVSDYRRIAR